MNIGKRTTSGLAIRAAVRTLVFIAGPGFDAVALAGPGAEVDALRQRALQNGRYGLRGA